jgi:hypothetical protein
MGTPAGVGVGVVTRQSPQLPADAARHAVPGVASVIDAATLTLTLTTRGSSSLLAKCCYAARGGRAGDCSDACSFARWAAASFG